MPPAGEQIPLRRSGVDAVDGRDRFLDERPTDGDELPPNTSSRFGGASSRFGMPPVEAIGVNVTRGIPHLGMHDHRTDTRVWWQERPCAIATFPSDHCPESSRCRTPSSRGRTDEAIVRDNNPRRGYTLAWRLATGASTTSSAATPVTMSQRRSRSLRGATCRSSARLRNRAPLRQPTGHWGGRNSIGSHCTIASPTLVTGTLAPLIQRPVGTDTDDPQSDEPDQHTRWLTLDVEHNIDYP